MNLVSTTARQVTFIWIGAGLLAAVALWPRQSANAQALSPTLVDPNLAVRTVVSGLIQPTTMAFLGDNDFFVLEKASGKVQRVVNGTIQSTVLDLAVNNASERGLLGIALHPDFPSNPTVYLYWTCQADPPAADLFTPTLTDCPDPPALGADTN